MRLDMPRGVLATGVAVLTLCTVIAALMLLAAATDSSTSDEDTWFSVWAIAAFVLLTLTFPTFLIGVPLVFGAWHTLARERRPRSDYVIASVVGVVGAFVPVGAGLIMSLVIDNGLVIFAAVIAGFVIVALVGGARRRSRRA